MNHAGSLRMSAPHMVGIDTAGSGLPGLAELLLARGARLSGSTDATRDAPTTRALRGLGAVIHPRTPNPVTPSTTCVIWSGRTTVAARPELDRARALGIPTLTVDEALGELVGRSATVVVAGSHSTATLSGMLTSALGHRNPGWVLRRPVAGQRLGHHSGGDLLIADLGQDYDLPTSTTLTVITAATAVRRDHLEEELENLEGLARRSQSVVLPIWDEGTAALSARLAMQPGPRVVTVGRGASANVRMLGISQDGSTGHVRLKDLDGEERELMVPVMGPHEAQHAALVVAAGQALGATMADLAEGLADFAGITRSLTVTGTPNGVTVLNSIAVHPAELAYDLAAARRLAGHRSRVVAVFEPTGWPATIVNGRELGRQLAVADRAVLLPVYDPAGTPRPGYPAAIEVIARTATHQGLTADHLHVLPSPQAAHSPALEQQVAALTAPGDVIAIIGTGRTAHLAQRICAALSAPAPATR